MESNDRIVCSANWGSTTDPHIFIQAVADVVSNSD